MSSAIAYDAVLENPSLALWFLKNLGKEARRPLKASSATTTATVKTKPLRDLSLDYLQNRSQEFPSLSSIKVYSVERPIERKPQNPEDVSAWASKCRALVEAREYEQLEALLQQGHSQGYNMDANTFSGIMRALSEAKQHEIVVSTFQRFHPTEPVCGECVINAVGSAYAIRNHTECEKIFAAYLGKVEFPTHTLNTVLKNFYAQTNPVVAQEFLMQIWERADEQTLEIAFKNQAEITQDAEEIVSLMYKFKADRGEVSESFYATVLECLLDLGHADLMIEVTRTIERDGLFGTARVQEVILQQLLVEKNAGRIEAYLSLFEQQNSISVSARPFERAAVHFSWTNDTDGIFTIVNWMSHCNLDITGPVMNAFLSCALRSGMPTKLVDNLEGWTQLGVVGSNATVHLIWKGLLKKYPDQGELVTKRLREMGKDFPRLYKGLSADTFTTTEVVERGGWASETVVVMPSSKDKNSTLYALRRVQELNRANTPELGIRVVEDLKRRNVKPTAQIFSTILHGLCKAGLGPEFDVALKLMEDSGYEPDAMLRLIFLRTNLQRLRESKNGGPPSLPTYTQKLLAVQRIKQFVSEHRSQLNLKMVTSIGFELLQLEEIDYAISMFNYFRGPGGGGTGVAEVSCDNHDSDSLSGLIKALAIKGQFHEIVQIVSQVVGGTNNSNSNGAEQHQESGVVLRPFFEWELQMCVARAARLSNKVIVEAMEQQVQLVQAYRRSWTVNDIDRSLKVVQGVFAGWEGQLVEAAAQP